ncbi:hypothetical protein H0H93_013780 [Arthromyces matolae]|nr:hypothetical protein H0H93_013780 [Arthromyces matolae]
MSFFVWAYATPIHPTAFTAGEPYPLTLRDVGYTGKYPSSLMHKKQSHHTLAGTPKSKQLAVIAPGPVAAGHNAISSPLSNTASPVPTVPHFYDSLVPYLAFMQVPNGANKDFEKIRELDGHIVQLMVGRLDALNSMLFQWGLAERLMPDSDRTHYPDALNSAKKYCVLVHSDANAPEPVKKKAREVEKEVDFRLKGTTSSSPGS